MPRLVRSLLLIFVVVLAAVVFVWRRPHSLSAAIAPAHLRAGGFGAAEISIHSEEPPVVTVPAHRGAVVGMERRGDLWVARVRAGVNPGVVAIRIEAPEAQPVTVNLTIDSYKGDDLLGLDEEGDRAAFRRWFTALAEAQYFLAPGERPHEINDCAALIRYAYREALRDHDAVWASSQHLPFLPPSESVRKYSYPYTPLGAALFRVDGGYAQFADAQTLQERNTFFVSRDVAVAQPGDLLFFRHAEYREPFHAMIYLGASYVTHGGARFVIYHTGSEPAEIRRPAVGELLAHPDPSWRPTSDNPSFLGVYRWDILKDPTS